MSETVETPATEEQPAAVTEEVTETPEVVETTTEDEIPQWVRDKLTKANNEAARYRHEAKEAADKARSEATAEVAAQIAELTDAKAALAAELETARVASLKLHAALSVGIPGESAAEFAELLKGETEEDIRAHAEKVKGLFGVSNKSDRAVDPTQGLDGYDSGQNAAPGLGRLRYAYTS